MVQHNTLDHTGITGVPAALSYASNANAVSAVSAAGAATAVSRADHVHDGVTSISHTSNTFDGPVTFTASGSLGITSPSAGTFNFNAVDTTGGGGGASLGAWTDYTPTWTTNGTAPTLGNGTLIGRYKALDSKTYAFHISFVFGSTSNAGTGDFQFALPAAAVAGLGTQIAAAHLLDAGTDNKLAVGQIAAGASIIGPFIGEGTNTVTGTTPMTWANGDALNVSGIYEAA